eukprot:CAMPEP_0184644048 /NCGR_PEP_ID=MMETSP0308-20130426/828_1 /TAXON_ID=38269 /ORGANISM="Gloeochaete witrockiana, Strain SAG 46.84" /LENGTH=116 /DNA_ID=CAMNT_0027072357 /DNA_START=381 /DNA_END=731 /DNA_ORIENTATION=-
MWAGRQAGMQAVTLLCLNDGCRGRWAGDSTTDMSWVQEIEEHTWAEQTGSQVDRMMAGWAGGCEYMDGCRDGDENTKMKDSKIGGWMDVCTDGMDSHMGWLEGMKVSWLAGEADGR